MASEVPAPAPAPAPALTDPPAAPRALPDEEDKIQEIFDELKASNVDVDFETFSDVAAECRSAGQSMDQLRTSVHSLFLPSDDAAAAAGCSGSSC